jgi:hypothetical protein
LFVSQQQVNQIRRFLSTPHTPLSVITRASLAEDAEDLAAFEDRVAEPTLSYEELLADLKAHGKL